MATKCRRKTDGITLSHRTAKVKQGYWSLFVQIHVKSLCLAAHIRIYSGHSKLLDECTDIKIIESDIPFDELERIMNGHKVIHGSYMSHICVDLSASKKIAPKIGALFESQYLQFVEILTLPQNSTIVKNNKAKSYK